MSTFSPLALTQALPYLPLAQGDIDYEVEHRSEPGLISTALHEPSTTVILVRHGKIAVPNGHHNIIHHANARMRLATLPGPYVAADLERFPQVVAMYLGAYGDKKKERVVAVDISALESVGEGAASSSAGAEAAGPSGAADADTGNALRAGGVAGSSGVAGTGMGAANTTSASVDKAFDETADADASAASGPSLLQSAVQRFDWVDLRGFAPHASSREVGQAVTAVCLGGWQETQHFCPACGAPVKPILAGWAQQCTSATDGRELFPRIEPAVIATIVDSQDRLLLQHNRAWQDPALYSVSAGFVEAGENLEHAVRRETAEETGIRVGEVKYLGSQPWPYRASLMMGFKGRALSTDIQVDGKETVDAMWVTRDEFTDAMIMGRINPPGKATIARYMIEEWLGREID